VGVTLGVVFVVMIAAVYLSKRYKQQHVANDNAGKENGEDGGEKTDGPDSDPKLDDDADGEEEEPGALANDDENDEAILSDKAERGDLSDAGL